MTAYVFQVACSDGVWRWFFKVPDAMDAGPFADKDHALEVAALFASRVKTGQPPKRPSEEKH
jgi:hypothetical protein